MLFWPDDQVLLPERPFWLYTRHIFKLLVRWLHSIIPVTLPGLLTPPLSCNSNYSGYENIY
ncbi:hypothetical protein DMH17_17105 [Raoultella planticola]|nr:hypothetical protein [Raoultella planticola]